MMLFHSGPAERFMHLIQQIAHIQENGSEQSKQRAFAGKAEAEFP